MKDCQKYSIPKYLCAKNGGLDNLEEYVKEFDATNIFLVVDPLLLKKNKYVASVVNRLVNTFSMTIFSSFTTNPTTKQVNTASESYRKAKPDAVIAIGGGSAIDLTKATMLSGKGGGRIEDFLAGRKLRTPFPPFIAAPSTCGTGSEGSPFAVITDHATMKKRGIENDAFVATLVILDPRLISSLETNILAASTIDALAHILESYVAKTSNEITRSACRGLLIGLPNTMEAAAKHDEDGVMRMLNNAYGSRLLYPRTGLTIAHALSHPLGAYTDMHHGACVAFFLSESLIYNYLDCKEQLDDAIKLMGFSNFDAFLQWLSDYIDRTGVRDIFRAKINIINLKIDTLANDAMESSNIASNPRITNSTDLQAVIANSIDRNLT